MLGIISAILGLVSRIFKFIFKNSKKGIDKVFLTLFIILSIILILLKGINIFIDAKDLFSANGHFWLKVLYFFFTQIWLSFLVQFGNYIFMGLIMIFHICSGNRFEDEPSYFLVGIPLIAMKLYYSIPIIAVICLFIF